MMKMLLGLGALMLLVAMTEAQETTPVQADPFGHWATSKSSVNKDTNTVIVRTQPFADDGVVNNFKFYASSAQMVYFLILDKVGEGDFTIAHKLGMKADANKRTEMNVMEEVKAGQYWAFGWGARAKLNFFVPSQKKYTANGIAYGYAKITGTEPEKGDGIDGFTYDKDGGNRGYAVWVTFQKDSNRDTPHGPWGIPAKQMAKTTGAVDRTWIRLYPFDRAGTVLLAETMTKLNGGVYFLLYERLPGLKFKIVYKKYFTTKASKYTTTQLLVNVEPGQYWGLGWDANPKMYKNLQTDENVQADGSNFAYITSASNSLSVGDITNDWQADEYGEMTFAFRIVYLRALALQPYGFGNEGISRSNTENEAKMIIIRSQTFTDRLNLGRYNTLETYTTKAGEMTFYIFNKVGLNNFEVVYSKTFAVNKKKTSIPMPTQLAEGQAWGVGWTSSVGLKYADQPNTDWFKYGPMYWYKLDSDQVSVGGWVNDTELAKRGARHFSVELAFVGEYQLGFRKVNSGRQSLTKTGRPLQTRPCSADQYVHLIIITIIWWGIV